MKKLLIVVMCLLIAAVVAVNAFADDGSAAFTATPASSTLYRGDSVTVSVNVTCNKEATSYGLSFNYDTSVFEVVNGSCSVPGTLVSSFNDGFAILFQNPTAYSGAVGTVTFKVKDDAAFGNATITGDASVKNGTNDVTASGCSIAITVACKHEYGAWTESGTGHARTCPICGDVQTADHTWDSGKVTKDSTCTEKGTMKYTCTTCGATKQEEIDMKEHQYGAWQHVDETNHKHVCAVCGKEETAAHTFSADLTAGKNTHWNECVCGDKSNETAHTYNTTVWSSDKNTHWHACACGAKSDEAAHEWGEGEITTKATESKAGVRTHTCKICSAKKTESIEKLQAKSPKTGGIDKTFVLIAIMIVSAFAFFTARKIYVK